MSNNPFENLEAHLVRLEAKLDQYLSKSSTPPAPEVGGIELAQEITRLSKPRIYALVSSGGIPNAKRGNKLYFSRADLLAWVQEGQRGETKAAA